METSAPFEAVSGLLGDGMDTFKKLCVLRFIRPDAVVSHLYKLSFNKNTVQSILPSHLHLISFFPPFLKSSFINSTAISKIFLILVQTVLRTFFLFLPSSPLNILFFSQVFSLLRRPLILFPFLLCHFFPQNACFHQIPGVQQFISKELSPLFIEPPAFEMKQCYNDSKCYTPLIFVLTPGAHTDTHRNRYINTQTC